VQGPRCPEGAARPQDAEGEDEGGLAEVAAGQGDTVTDAWGAE